LEDSTLVLGLSKLTPNNCCVDYIILVAGYHNLMRLNKYAGIIRWRLC